MLTVAVAAILLVYTVQCKRDKITVSSAMPYWYAWNYKNNPETYAVA